MSSFNELTIELSAIDCFREINYQYLPSEIIAPNAEQSERNSYHDVILHKRLRAAVSRINPHVASHLIDDTIRHLFATASQDLCQQNKLWYQYLKDGIVVEASRKDRTTEGVRVNLIDYVNIDNNDFFITNQFTVKADQKKCIPDLVVFLNGLPIAVFEFKNPASDDTSIESAYEDNLTRYKNTIPDLFSANFCLVVSDGIHTKVGSLTAGFDRYMPWRKLHSQHLVDLNVASLEILIKGMFRPDRLLKLLKFYVTFDDSQEEINKKIAAYHQFFAVEKAIARTEVVIQPTSENKQIGVIWHTQGSGKSLSMAFYVGQVMKSANLKNPTILILTDRNDLDDQLLNTFNRTIDVLGEKPKQATNCKDLQEKLNVASGGIIFTTIQKFSPDDGKSYPLLSYRHNIVVIVDEAHRTQYDLLDGYARHVRDGLPNASFIGFTGTPIELAGKNTYAVFGEQIDSYDMAQSIDDGATVPIYYESRIVKLSINEEERKRIDQEMDELTEAEEANHREKMKTQWAKFAALAGTKSRLELIAKDILNHFEQRSHTGLTKGMIVCMSRENCVSLYEELVSLRPEWHSDDLLKGSIKIIMTVNENDTNKLKAHKYSKKQRDELAKRIRNPKDPLKLVIVRDMWLTGFDAPCLNTLYVDKLMRGHNLMQAIARVNRVFNDKPGGLVVDYIGITDELQQALRSYSNTDREQGVIDLPKAISILLEKFDVVTNMLLGVKYDEYFIANDSARLKIVALAMNHILSLPDGKLRFCNEVLSLSKAFSLVPTAEEAIRIRDDLILFQVIRASFQESSNSVKYKRKQYDEVVRDMLAKAVVPTEILNIFDVAGIKTKNISILSDEFLEEMHHSPQRNLAIELLEKLLRDEIKSKFKNNIVQSKKFTDMIDTVLKKFEKKLLSALEILNEYIHVAKQVKKEVEAGQASNLTSDEIAFYDALAANYNAKEIMGKDKLKEIACLLVIEVRNNTSIDWTTRANAQAKLRKVVKHTLRKYGYPPDLEEEATLTVLEQAKTLAREWAEE